MFYERIGLLISNQKGVFIGGRKDDDVFSILALFSIGISLSVFFFLSVNPFCQSFPKEMVTPHLLLYFFLKGMYTHSLED